MTLMDDLKRLQEAVQELARQVEKNRSMVSLHEEQVNGERGLSAAIDQLAAEVKSLRKAAYWVAGLIVAGAITFAFSVLSMVGGGG